MELPDSIILSVCVSGEVIPQQTNPCDAGACDEDERPAVVGEDLILKKSIKVVISSTSTHLR